MKPILNLGCADDIREDCHNVDHWNACTSKDPRIHNYLTCKIDQHVNLDSPWWPWPDNQFEKIIAHDIIEHLPNKIQTMNECYRVLTPKGILEIIVPTTNGAAAFQDPTHVSYWNRNSFWYYEEGSPYRERFALSYGIIAKFKVLGVDVFTSPVKEEGEKLAILLEAVK